ncbi:MAG TPA: hypothetical protein VGG68_14365 [Caulobacteraceae bacterium]
MSRLAGMFAGLHVMLADATGTPELALSEDDAADFMGDAQRVLRHYRLQTQQRTIDWITFMGTCGAIYGTRAVAIRLRWASEGRRGGARPASGQRPRIVPFAAPGPPVGDSDAPEITADLDPDPLAG